MAYQAAVRTGSGSRSFCRCASQVTRENVQLAVREGTAPPYIGIRFKCFEAATRDRGLRTLDLFVTTLVREGGLREAGHSEDGLPRGLVLTLPKVSTPEQVDVMVEACEQLEAGLGLPAGRLRFEVQMETAPMILGTDGTCPIPAMLHRTDGRVEALHYGTYDYSDSLQIAAQYQSMEHPAADHAKAVMQVAVAGTGVRLSDGSTNILPTGSDRQKLAAWRLHARLVRRSLERGYYQGWDLHAHQLPTRYLATYFFYREGFPAAALRLKNYVHGIESEIMDEPATARALARFVHRGVLCGAISGEELEESAGIGEHDVAVLATADQQHLLVGHDATGAGVPGVTVVATQTVTKATHDTTTAADGTYSLTLEQQAAPTSDRIPRLPGQEPIQSEITPAAPALFSTMTLVPRRLAS